MDKMLNIIDTKNKLTSMGDDFKYRDEKVDIIGYNIEDSIKAIVSALDGIAKTLSFIKKINSIDSNVKIPNVLHDKINNYKSFDFSNSYTEIMKTQYNNMKLITLMRNDLTHDKAFHAIRQSLFYGRGTPSVNQYNIMYIDLLMWDHKTNGFNDFTTEQNCMVTYLSKNINDLYELFITSLEVLKSDIIYLCKQKSNLDTANIATGYEYQLINFPSNNYVYTAI